MARHPVLQESSRRLESAGRGCRSHLPPTCGWKAVTRLFSAVWLVAVAASGDVALGQQSIEVQQPKKVSQFVGKWGAESPSPDGITRMEISADPTTIFIRTWSACQQAECYWGERQIDISDADDRVLSVTWAVSSRIDSQRILLLPDGRLRVDWHTRFYDSSEPRDRTQYLVRADSAVAGKPASSVPESAQRSLSSVALFFVELSGGQLSPVGCGFLVQRGLVVTSYHVVKNASQLQARVFGQSALYPVSAVVKVDEAHDVALVRIEGFRAWPLPLAERGEIGVNDQVFVITDASKGTISAATVSSVSVVNGISRIQITTPVLPSESGAPVFNKYGQIVGAADSNPEAAERPGLVIHVRRLIALMMPDLAPPLEAAKAVDSRPVMLSRIPPRYTEEARRLKIWGQVRLRILVGADGEVKEVEVISGLPSGLTEEAVRVARGSRFKPAMKDGRPVDCWILMSVEFNLR